MTMKALTLALFLLVPTLAHAGAYTETSGYASTGAANVPAVVATLSLPGGSLTGSNAAIFEAECRSGGGLTMFGYLSATIGTTNVFPYSLPMANIHERVLLRMVVRRTSATTAAVQSQVYYSDNDIGTIDLGTIEVTGLSFGGMQTWKLTATSNEEGGINCLWAGVIR